MEKINKKEELIESPVENNTSDVVLEKENTGINLPVNNTVSEEQRAEMVSRISAEIKQLIPGREVEKNEIKNEIDKYLDSIKKSGLTYNFDSFYDALPDFVINRKLADIVGERKEYVDFNENDHKCVTGNDAAGNYLDFRVPIKNGKTDEEGAKLNKACNQNKSYAPIDEKERITAIKQEIKNNHYYEFVLGGYLPVEFVVKIIKSANLDIPTNIKKLVDFEKKKDSPEVEKESLQNTYYPLDPEMILKKRKANLSYSYQGERFKREKDIFSDLEGSSWFEVEASSHPEKQMAISLLAQPFFHISPIIQKTIKENKAEDLIEKVSPKMVQILKPILKPFERESIKFLSKGMDFKRLPEKEDDKIYGEYIVFGALFDNSTSDRDLSQNHNIHRSEKSYRLFDFGSSSLPNPANELNQKYISSGTDEFVKQVKCLCYGNKYESMERNLPVPVIMEAASKLEEIDNFFKDGDGEKFFQAALKKSNYFNYVKQCKETNQDYYDSHELYLGLLQKIKFVASALLEEVEKHKNDYLEDNNQQSGKAYEKMTESLNRLI